MGGAGVGGTLSFWKSLVMDMSRAKRNIKIKLGMEEPLEHFVEVTGRKVDMSEVYEGISRAESIEITRAYRPTKGPLSKLRGRGKWQVEKKSFISPSEAREYVADHFGDPDLIVNLSIGDESVQYRMFGKRSYEQQASIVFS
jgi:hypothetical protein